MKILVTGAASGLGRCIVEALHYQGDHTVYQWDAKPSNVGQRVDISNGWEVSRAAYPIHELDVLVNCAGINMPNYIADISEQEFERVMGVNIKGMFLVTKTLLPVLHGGTVLNIVSNASHLPMTASLTYNASKAAAHMMTLQMARELWVTHKLTVFGISPNKLRTTDMTKHVDATVARQRGWTAHQAHEKQLAALPINEETDPLTLAEFIAFLLSTKERHRFLHGTIIPYGGP